MNDPRAVKIGYVATDASAGFRLKRFEALNWGTFDGCVCTLELDGRNGLLTGDSRSDPSVLVDAITTLLAPSPHTSDNDAAGADARERTLRAYLLGHDNAECREGSGATEPVGPRDSERCSVILGVFHDAGCGRTVTLAQVFWMKVPQGELARFFVMAERELSIGEHFMQSGTDIGPLRQRLLAANADVEDSLPKYDAWIRRCFGIDNGQALALFHRAVSMKSVGDLTDFVRDRILEPFDVAPRIQALIARFDDLNRAHAAVLEAKQRAALLTPLIDDSEHHASLGQEIEALRDCREALRGHFARLKLGLIDDRLARFENVLEHLNAQIKRLETRRDDRRRQVDELRRAVADNGGDRIERLGAQIRKLENLRNMRRLKAERYGALAKRLGERPVGDESDFIAQRMRLKTWRNEARDRDAALENELTEHQVAFLQAQAEHDALRDELHSLERRRSNIDAHAIRIRAALCESLGLAEQEIPFAGELLQVRDEACDWEGAAERLLRGFALSLLVPDDHCEAVAAWIERSDLRGRLVYFQVGAVQRRELPELHRDSLVRKLVIEPDSPFHDWIQCELAHRFDVACCATQAQFRREARAIMRSGRIKDPTGRHEHDDRYPIDDRSRYVLGWRNAAKVAALEAKLERLAGSRGEIGERIGKVQEQRKLLAERLDALIRLEEFVEFEDLDWGAVAAEIEALAAEGRRLEGASDVLQQFDQRLQQAAQGLAATEKELDVAKDRRSRIQQRKADAGEMRNATQAVVEQAQARTSLLAPDVLRERLEQLRAQALGEAPPTIEACDNHEWETRAFLQERIDGDGRKLDHLRDKIVQAMLALKARFGLETAECDASIEAAFDDRERLDRLRGETRPRLEARFKALLDVYTSDEIAGFDVGLARARETLRERIARINESLARLDDDPDRCIALEPQPSPDAEICAFQAALRTCTEGAMTGSEAKFLQVKAIIDRFRGRDGLADEDRCWTAKVCDVRNGFLFTAGERSRADGSKCEPRSDSGGESGAREEKLAYTLLAASLADRFGLEGDAERSRSLRFVVIGEGFLLGSDESVQHGLRLFQQLGAQLLIVAPQRKTLVIEPFVSTVGLLLDEGGRASKLRNLTIEAYRAHELAQAIRPTGTAPS